MDTMKEESSITEISEVQVKEIVNSDFCKVYEVVDTPFNVRHFLNEDGTTKEVVVCIGDEAIGKYPYIENAMAAVKNRDWQLILVGAWVYGQKMSEIKKNKED